MVGAVLQDAPAPRILVLMLGRPWFRQLALLCCCAWVVGCAEGSAGAFEEKVGAADGGDAALPDKGPDKTPDAATEVDAGVIDDAGMVDAPVDPNCKGPDGDKDGTPDCRDACPDDANKTKAGKCGCGSTDTDEDIDGTLDCDDACPKDKTKQADEGMCGCGKAETDGDADGTADCVDMCPDDADKTEPGDCGCGRVDADRTGDGKVDCAVFEDGMVAAAYSHSCALGSDDKAYCWGDSGYGRLGSGTATASKTPVVVAGLTGVLQVSSRGDDNIATTCALLVAGGVRCWGYGGVGTMGNGGTTATNLSPLVVTGLNDALQISVGTRHVCAVHGAGAIACWGLGTAGRLGNADIANASMPVAVQAIDDGLQVSAGDAHTCAVRGSGEVWCWGDRTSGRLGDGGAVTGSQLTPALVSGLTDAVQVSAGYVHSCAVRATGGVVCWGQRNNGRIGDGGPVSGNQLTPIAVTGLIDAVQVSAGYYHSCAVRSTGQIMCWGYRVGGRMGDGLNTGGDQTTPIAVMGITDATQVVAGYEHSCAKTAAGKALCWGNNGSGRLGDGTTTTAYAPVAVSGLP